MFLTPDHQPLLTIACSVFHPAQDGWATGVYDMALALAVSAPLLLV